MHFFQENENSVVSQSAIVDAEERVIAIKNHLPEDTEDDVQVCIAKKCLKGDNQSHTDTDYRRMEAAVILQVFFFIKQFYWFMSLELFYRFILALE